MKTIHMLSEWNLTRTISLTVSFTGTSMGWWWPPPQGEYKLNFDGSLNSLTQLGANGGIIRNASGDRILAYSGATNAKSPEKANLKALTKGIHLCCTLQLPNLQIEGDCRLLVSSLHHQQNMSRKFMGTWRKLLENLTQFDKWEIS